MIHAGQQQQEKAYIDVNAESRKIEGYLEDEKARTTLGDFLRYNLKMFAFLLTGFRMEPYQTMMLKGWMKKNFSLCVAPRAAGKSTLIGLFSLLFCLLNKDTHIIIVSTNFRSSRTIIEKIELWARRAEGILLRQCIPVPAKGGMVYKRPDMFRVTFANLSSIKALPLGDANNLRGQRCNVLIIDEGLLIPQQTIDNVLKPFLFAAASAEIEERQRTIQREGRLIKAGKMKEEDRSKFKPNSKMIVLSSASYRWEHLYTIYESYLKKIFGQEKEEDRINQKEEERTGSYLVQQFSYTIVPEHILDKGMLDDLKNGTVPESVIEREYKSQFIQDSDGYFKAAKMEACTIKNGMEPCIELRGDKDAEYVLAIDPSIGAGDAADHFAMCVLKIIKKPDSGKKIGLVVHQYAVAGADLKHHFLYLAYLLKHFNIVYVACDTSQGESGDFISAANASDIFHERKLELNAMEVDFGREDQVEIKKQIRAGYNREGRVIVQKQYFHSAYILVANEQLQYAINFNHLYFAGKALANDAVRERLTHQHIDRIYEIHPEWAVKAGSKEEERLGDIYSFMETQDDLMDLVKKECALIEQRRNQFTVSFDLPPAMTRNRKNPNRPRRDSYTALCLANWALKLYTEAMDLPDDSGYEIPLTVMV